MITWKDYYRYKRKGFSDPDKYYNFYKYRIVHYKVLVLFGIIPLFILITEAID